jgi:hypothetical protein
MMMESTCRCRLHQSRNPVLSVGISPPQLALERYPTTLILSINLCYIYSHVHSTPPDLGMDAVDIGIVTPLGNIAILVSCSADSVSVNYLRHKTLLIPLHHSD